MNGVPHWGEMVVCPFTSEFTGFNAPGDTVCNKHVSLNNDQTHK